jgi:hypothetical protein
MREEVVKGWRGLHNEPHKLHASPHVIRIIISRRMRWVGKRSTHGRDEKCTQNLMGKLERKRPLGRLRRRWQDNVRMDVRKIRWEDVDWIHLVLDRDLWRPLVNTVMNPRVP